MKHVNHPKHRYIITGAAGFIGSYVCRALLKQEPSSLVVGVDALTNYYDPKIKLRRLKELTNNKRFIFCKASILNKTAIRAINDTYAPDTLIHLAASVGVRNGELFPLEYYKTNVTGTMTVLETLAPSLSRAVIFSSSSVYGKTGRLPFRESEPVTLSTPLSVYGVSKAAMEAAVRNFATRHIIPVTIVRPFSIYGPDGRPDMLPMKVLAASLTNTPIEIFAAAATHRDWTYIDDCVDMIMRVLETSGGIRTVNIATGHPIRLDRLITIMLRIIRRYGHSVRCVGKPANNVEMPRTWADTSSIKKIYSGRPVSFEKGFSRTADFFFEHLPH
jgi:UDP-glucuronate 4-epimerase